MCWSSVVVATTLRAGRSEVQIQVRARRPDRLQDPSSLLFNGYRVPPRGGGGAKWLWYTVNDAHLSSPEVKN